MSEIDGLIKQAETLGSQGKWREAAAYLQKAAHSDPSHGQARKFLVQALTSAQLYREAVEESMALAELARTRGMEEEAVKIYQEVLAMDAPTQRRGIFDKKAGSAAPHIREALLPHLPEVCFRLGVLVASQGQLDEAIAYLRKSLEASPGNAIVHNYLGLYYLEKGLEKEAEGEFQEVVRLAPDEALAYEKLAEISQRRGRASQNTVVWLRSAADNYAKKDALPEAIRVYEKILEVEPQSKDVLGRLGELYGAQGRLDLAIAASKRLADAYMSEGLFDKVIPLYERLVDWEPENVELRNKVIDIYRKSLAVDPSNLNARHKLIANLLGKGSAEEAVSEFLELSKTFLDKGLYDDAIANCRKILELDPKNVRAHEILAEVHLKKGNMDEARGQYMLLVDQLKKESLMDKAEELYKKMLSLFPDSVDLHMQMGADFLKNKDLNEAAREYVAILEKDPAHLDALRQLGAICLEKSELDKAVSIFRKVSEIAPDDTESRRVLIRIYEDRGDLEALLSECLSCGNVLLAKGGIQ
ncbi:MAG: tetratricopeptide repeat protein [Armatimonadetes bacterium]|nr:tetratricopeptide repeat protein [Armatimonadota bacterium]